ncbi:hypothetical protein [Streptomyces sp. NPDC056049]|uniref:hypothetical protein n=1 Tax=Streptomyces sp. NPDC056049 TaxID=3345693 RepID=UPI0035E2813A
MSFFLAGCQKGNSGPGATRQPARSELVDLKSHIVDHARRAAAREPYTPPDGTRRERIARGVGRLLDGDPGDAARILAGAGFRVTRLTDTVSGRRFDEVAARERGAEDRWGRLYVPADGDVRWSVQVPHPVADRDTEVLGARLLEAAPHGALVLAGAHRAAGRGDSADVAHRTDSAFHAFVLELQKRDVPGMQLHGFAKASDRPYDAVLSTGAARTASEDAALLADRMESRDLRVCRGWSATCPLEGTTNAQGKAAERRGTSFLHVELAPAARGDGRAAESVRTALAGLLETWAAGGDRRPAPDRSPQ